MRCALGLVANPMLLQWASVRLADAVEDEDNAGPAVDQFTAFYRDGASRNSIGWGSCHREPTCRMMQVRENGTECPAKGG